MTIKLAIFGDSHFACVKQAMDAELVNVDGFDIEFWGHAGRRWRTLKFADGAIRSDDPTTEMKFSMVNKHRRTFLPVDAFDAILFVGARIGLVDLFATHQTWTHKGNFVSTGLRHRQIQDRLSVFLGYKFAQAAAAEGKAKILISPKSFPSDGQPFKYADQYAGIGETTGETRQRVWQDLIDVADADGIGMLAQPDHTVVNGLYTDPKYGVTDYVEKNDYDHKNLTYGALVLEQGLEAARRATQ